MTTILDLSDLLYNYERDISHTNQTDIKNSIITILKENQMTPFYKYLCDKYKWSLDETLLSSLSDANEKELESIESKRKDAEANAGDMEVLDSMFARARYFSKIGDWDEAFKSYDEILKKEKTSTGKKIDANMEKAKIALFNHETKKLKDLIAESKRLVELGGDWDRRNRLKVYEAHYLLITRDIKQAAKLFLDCIATFTCTELCTYKKFMSYALLTNIVHLNRNDLRKKLINDPHVITVIRELPNVQKLLHGIYNCDYTSFFKAILEVYPDMLENRLLGPISVYLIREYRVLAYSQFLEAYKSVMLTSMSTSFGVTPSFLDRELSKFISSGRLNAKIDKVGNIIETSRPDKKNAQYQDIIKKGDVLLNQIQKLVRVIDV